MAGERVGETGTGVFERANSSRFSVRLGRAGASPTRVTSIHESCCWHCRPGPGTTTRPSRQGRAHRRAPAARRAAPACSATAPLRTKRACCCTRVVHARRAGAAGAAAARGAAVARAGRLEAARERAGAASSSSGHHGGRSEAAAEGEGGGAPRRLPAGARRRRLHSPPLTRCLFSSLTCTETRPAPPRPRCCSWPPLLDWPESRASCWAAENSGCTRRACS